MRIRSGACVIGVALLLVPMVPAVAEDLFLDADGLRLRYTVQGEGDETVILLHGLSASVDMWRLTTVVPALQDRYRVVLLDCRGHGKSDKPHEPSRYGAAVAADVIRLMDHLEVERAHVGGYSMGGMITLKLVAAHPARLLSAVVAGFGWVGDDEEWPELVETLATGLEEGRGADVMVELLAAEGAPTPERMKPALEFALNTMNDPLALAAAVRGFPGLTDVTAAQLRANRVPTLALVGADDPLGDDVTAMSAVMESLTVHRIEGADHMTAFARPEFAETLSAFVAAHPAEAARPRAVGE